MSVSPRLKYPLVAGIGTTNRSLAAVTRAAKIVAAAILNAAEGAKPVESVVWVCLLFIDFTVLQFYRGVYKNAVVDLIEV
jgi:hypothetical protein